MARPTTSVKDDTRWCSMCKVYKPMTAFYHKRRGLQGGYCLPCKKLYYRANKERIKQANRRRYLEQAYGLTPDEHAALLISQSGLCAICEQSDSQGLHVDHCHTTGKIRGMLCGKCNRGLGHFDDNTEFLEQALFYLKKHSCA